MIREQILKNVKKGDRFADIGSGDLSLALEISNLEAHIWAYDIVKGDNFTNSKYLHFCYLNFNKDKFDFPQKKYDGIILLNSLQFFDKKIVLEKLLPNLTRSLKDNGKIYIETFTKRPGSDLEEFPSLKSFYEEKDFELQGLKIELADSGTDVVVREGRSVSFHYLDLILSKT